jgi:hypothetical protein
VAHSDDVTHSGLCECGRDALGICTGGARVIIDSIAPSVRGHPSTPNHEEAACTGGDCWAPCDAHGMRSQRRAAATRRPRGTRR